ncbi:phage terminase large subunit-like protein [Clostridium beijerinckii]|uniref:phage terminase large subunit family protein n=1 Tax=Clostridium beijerinckii TaxID=1520 RepID=UPI00156F7CAF|nr:terminase [Clostridium beijerinckii]NRT34536.1 phage terminase large subunit-like protein [Clostridium beijerinckii]NRT46034.1 phage terminase large subunit-like protein [Clostridium beijerinckii]NRZ19964.1 phage terminase large subunit-like protein [Clostridium beijerinckii]
MIYFDNLKFDTELKYEVYLLNKYLTKHYDSGTADKLLKTNSRDLDRLAKALSDKDIEFFCLYFMSDTFVPKGMNDDGSYPVDHVPNVARTLSRGHYELWDIANEIFVEDKRDKAAIIEPRGYAKTTIFDMAVSVYLHCYKKSLFTLLGAKTDTDATQFLDSIKKVFNENQKIIKNFGKLIDIKAVKANGERYTVNANEVEFTNGTYIRTVGSGTSVRGSNWGGIRPTVFIGDDFQDEKNILTDAAREKQYSKWTKEVEEVGDKAVYRTGKKIKAATKIIAIGTVLHIDCLMSKLSRNGDYYTILRRAIILETDKTVEDIFENDLWLQCHDIYFDEKLNKEERKEKAKQFYEDHKEEMRFETWWPEKWDCFNDLAIKYWEDRAAFMSELMNDATAIGEKWFKSIATRTSEEIENHKFIKTALVIDPAASTSKKNDYTAMGVMSKATNDFTYVRDLLMKRLGYNDYCEKAVDFIRRHEDITHVVIEKNTFMGADVLKIQELIDKEPKLKSRRLEFINKMQKTNKDEKISTVMDPVNNGQIVINSDCEDSSAAVKQVLEFQGQKYTPHDDFIDMISEGENALKEIKVVSKVEIFDRNSLF